MQQSHERLPAECLVSTTAQGQSSGLRSELDHFLGGTVIGTAANINDVTQAAALLHGGEEVVFADAGYRGVTKREETRGLKVDWHIAMRPGQRRALEPTCEVNRLLDKVEQLKASVRAKVEHPFRVVKQQFG